MRDKWKKGIPFLLLFALLIVMYGTDVGVPGITKYWSEFKLFDMQMFYTVDTFRNTIKHIGNEGIRHYLYYFAVDFAFILTMFWVQCQLTKSVIKRENKTFIVMMILVWSRGSLDIMEDILLALIMVGRVPDSVVSIVSKITALKLFDVYIWIIILLIMYGINAWENKKKYMDHDSL